LRFVSKTGVFDDDWADNVIYDSEMQREGNNIKFTFLVYIYEFTFTLQLAMSASLLFLYEENNYSVNMDFNAYSWFVLMEHNVPILFCLFACNICEGHYIVLFMKGFNCIVSIKFSRNLICN
jgi:hypothetical protein